MTRIAKYTAIILITLSGVIILWQFNMAIVIFLLSLATAAAFRPGIELFIRRDISPNWALVLTYSLAVIIIAAVISAISGPFLRDLQQMTDDLTQEYEQIISFWPQGGNAVQKALAEQLPEPQRLYDTLTSEEGLNLAQSFLGVAANFFDLLGKIGIILILSLYWSADRVRFERLWLSLIPVERRKKARDIWREIETGVGAYIRSEAIQSFLAILLLWLGYWAIGLPYPTVLALSGAIFWLIPWLGVLLAMIPPLIVGLGISPGLGLLAAFYTVLVLIVLEFIVEPRFFSRQRYSSILIVLLLIALALSFGLIGVIFAPPFAAAIQILFNNMILNREAQSQSKALKSSELEHLEQRLEEVRESIAGSETSPSQEVSSLVDRLDTLIDKTRQHFDSNGIPIKRAEGREAQPSNRVSKSQASTPGSHRS
ncbi:MAG TPA: AI-2E family transporter [Anaerolineales bacterium]